MGFNTVAWKTLEALKTTEKDQDKWTINKIVTHEFPDLDCLYSIYLLRKFGEKRYNEIRNAELIFVPAGTRYLGKNGKQLLKEGVIALDLEGGLFDHHPSSTTKGKDLSTASLVASELQVIEDKNIMKLIGFINANDIKGKGIQSRAPVDHLIALPNLLKGLNLRHGPDYQKVYHICEELFEAAYTFEDQWFQALDDISKGYEFIIKDSFNILAFRSNSISAAAAGRYKNGNLCVIEGRNRALNITSQKNKLWPQPDLTKIAKIIRLSESLRSGQSVNREGLGNVGSVVDWYLHESLAFFSRGSFKKSDVPLSLMSLHEIMELVIFCFIPDKKHLGVLGNYYNIFKETLGLPMSFESVD